MAALAYGSVGSVGSVASVGYSGCPGSERGSRGQAWPKPRKPRLEQVVSSFGLLCCWLVLFSESWNSSGRRSVEPRPAGQEPRARIGWVGRHGPGRRRNGEIEGRARNAQALFSAILAGGEERLTANA